MVFHWSLSGSKSSQVSWIRLRILAVLSNAVSTHPPTSSRPFNNPLVIGPDAPITTGTIVTFMFHSFFNSLARSKYLSFFSLSFGFILWSAGTAMSTILQILFFFVDYFDIVAGVLQGDTLAPYLFIICLDYVLRTSIDKIRENGFELTKRRSKRYPAKTITDADYADDLALLANTPN